MNNKKHKDIIITGSIGEAGAMSLALSDPERIKKRFPYHYMNEIVECGKKISNKETCAAQEKKIKKIVSEAAINDIFVSAIDKKGLMPALWYTGEILGSGFIIDADRIPISQMSVEICELFGSDIYKADSYLSFIICTENGNELCEMLRAEGIEAVIAGHTDKTKAKKICMGDVVRYVDKPR